jgi:hypothetical protein
MHKSPAARLLVGNYEPPPKSAKMPFKRDNFTPVESERVYLEFALWPGFMVLDWNTKGSIM